MYDQDSNVMKGNEARTLSYEDKLQTYTEYDAKIEDLKRKVKKLKKKKKKTGFLYDADKDKIRRYKKKIKKYRRKEETNKQCYRMIIEEAERKNERLAFLLLSYMPEKQKFVENMTMELLRRKILDDKTVECCQKVIEMEER